MKTKILNKDNLTDDEITNIVNKNFYIIINSQNEVLLKNNHNTYTFIDDILDQGFLNETLKISNKAELPFYLIKNYISDYPFINENSLYNHNYYIVNYDLEKLEAPYLLIPLNDLKDTLMSNKFANPRNCQITEEMLEVINFIK